jgi:hypothetical protein
MADAEFYQQPIEVQRAAQQQLSEQEAALGQAFARWQKLESRQGDPATGAV